MIAELDAVIGGRHADRFLPAAAADQQDLHAAPLAEIELAQRSARKAARRRPFLQHVAAPQVDLPLAAGDRDAIR
jgi:hypothetical protein